MDPATLPALLIAALSAAQKVAELIARHNSGNPITAGDLETARDAYRNVLDQIDQITGNTAN